MRVGRVSITKPTGSMGCFAYWSCRRTGYWRWALYFNAKCKGFAVRRARSITGSVFPHFGGEVITPLGSISLATQPRMDGLK